MHIMRPRSFTTSPTPYHLGGIKPLLSFYSYLLDLVARSLCQENLQGELKAPPFSYLPHSTDENYRNPSGLPSALEQVGNKHDAT